MPAKVKEAAAPRGVLMMRPDGALPPWDDAVINQENWGGPLGLPARAPNAVVDLRSTEDRVVLTPDTDERDAFAQCIASVVQRPVEMDWRRPAAIIAPFRPMVHRNTTPFLSPYANEFQPFDARAEEESARPGRPPSGKKNDPKAVVLPPAPLHVQFPEIVRVLEPEVVAREMLEKDKESIVTEYRTLQPLTQPYDATLEYGCAETPAAACGSRYSTALRYRLREVHQLESLSEPPPFVMGAFNSALCVIACAQGLVKPGEYLWELIYPHAPGTQHPVYNPNGKYIVRLYIDGAFRRVTVDDYLPVDALGRPLLSITSEKEFWPAILAKAIFKALGPVQQHQLFTDPEAIVACLMGGWVPQYIDPRCDSAAACRALFLYQRQLHKNATEAATASSQRYCSGAPESIPGARLGHPDNAAPQVNVESTPENTQAPAEAVLEQLPFAPPAVFACGVEGKSAQRQVYAIREIVSLENTLALRVLTNTANGGALEAHVHTCKSSIESVLKQRAKEEQNRKDCATEEGPSVWVTLGDLAACMSLVVFIPLDELCALRHTTRLAVADEAPAAGGASRRRHATSVVSSHLGAEGHREVVRWIHIKCEREEQIAFVSIGSPAPPSSLSAASIGSSYPPSPRSGRSVSSGATSPASPQPVAPTMRCLPRSMANEVTMDLYTWSRGDPFSCAGKFAYETGRLSCNIYTVPVGSHILRITAAGMEPHHAVVMLATREFFAGDERDVLRDAGVFRLCDAGVHEGIKRKGEEVVWFKRRLAVKEPTVASFIVASLEHTEDLAAHRDLPMTMAKDTKSTQARVVTGKGAAAAAKHGSIDDLPAAPCGIRIIQHCTLVLIDLDTGATRTGAIGRLVRQTLEPNHSGYLIIVYSVIAPDENEKAASKAEGLGALLSEGGGSGRVEDTPVDASSLVHGMTSMSAGVASSGESLILSRKNSGTAGTNAESSMAEPLCGRGLWKLTISADRLLDSYRSVLHSVSSFEEQGQLRRGSRALLFAYICSINEQTCLTLQMDLYARSAIPFTVKVFRGSVGSAEGAATAPPPVYVSDTSTRHLFVPHVMLDLYEKSRTVSYTVEAWMDAARVAEWEVERRHAQAQKFRLARAAAGAAAEAQRAGDLAAHAADPLGFAERLEQSASAPAEVGESAAGASPPGQGAKKTRSGAGERRHRHADRSAAAREETRPPQPSPLQLDATDPPLAVRFAVQMDFSARVDVRPAPTPTVEREPVTALRAAFAGAEEQVPPPRPSPQAASVASPRETSKRVARDAAEEAQRGELGRANRQRFLHNPYNVLLPYLLTDEDSPTAPRVVVTEPTDEPLSRYAPLLEPAAFRVAQGSPPAPQQQQQQQPEQQQQQQQPQQPQQQLPQVQLQRVASGSQQPPTQRSKSPGDRVAARSTTFSSASLSSSPPAAEEDADAAEIRAPAAALALRLADEMRHQHERRSAGREALRDAVREYWVAHAPESAVGSLLAQYEEDATKQRRGKSRVSS